MIHMALRQPNDEGYVHIMGHSIMQDCMASKHMSQKKSRHALEFI